MSQIETDIEAFYSGKPMEFMEFGKPNTNNERIYTVEVFGIPNFGSSITLVHLFFGKFKVIAMLTNVVKNTAKKSKHSDAVSGAGV